MINSTLSRTKFLTRIALLIAIVFVQTSVPFLGYIPVGPLNLTLLPITVAVAAVAFGVRTGTVVGMTWGAVTWVRSFVAPTSPLAVIVMVNPLISVVPRVLMGIVCAVTFMWLQRKINLKLAAIIASMLSAMTNTVLFLGQIAIYYHGQSQALYHLDVHALLPYLLGVAATNGVGEMVLAGIVAPLIALPLRKRFG